MRSLLSTLLLCTFTCAPAIAKNHPQQTEIEKLATSIAADRPGNAPLVLNKLMDRINGVDKAIGATVDYRLALQIADCSDLTAHPDDPGKYGEGIAFSEIDAKKAIKECTIAFQIGGANIGLVLANLSRAYNKLEDY